MKDPAWVAGEPGFDLGMLVGGVIVEDGVDHFAGRDGALDAVEKADQFLMGMALHAAPVHDAVERVGQQTGWWCRAAYSRASLFRICRA